MSVVGAAFAYANAAFIPVAFAYESPGKPSGFVNDFASIFSATEKQELGAKLSQFNTDTGTEVVVVTIKALGTETIETYATKLFEEWGIGKKGRDNGLLILIAPNERALRIEVGYGLEGTITDAESFGIIRDVISPAFKKGQYYVGVSGAVDRIMSKVTAESVESISSEMPVPASLFSEPIFYYALFMFLWFLIALFAKTESWWLGGVVGFLGGYIVSTFTVAIIVAVIGLIVDFIVSRNRSKIQSFLKNNAHIFWGGGRGGGFGGGFSGFGGGRSGGGGSSGSW